MSGDPMDREQRRIEADRIATVRRAGYQDAIADLQQLVSSTKKAGKDARAAAYDLAVRALKANAP